MNEPSENQFKEKVFEKIREERVSIRPKIDFTLRVIALVLFTILFVIVSALLFGYILLTLRISREGSLLDFGFRGFLLYLSFFPWIFLAIDALLMIGIEVLIRKFRFGYRRPALYLLLGTIALVAAAGFIVDRDTHIDDMLLRRADQNALPPPLVSIYEGVRHVLSPERGACECVITSVSGNVITAYSDEHPSDTISIIMPLNNPFANQLQPGETIFVAGGASSGTIHAFGVLLISTSSDHQDQGSGISG